MSKFSKIFSLFSPSPSAIEPPLLPVLPPLPQFDDAQAEADRKAALQVAAARKGISSTVKTSSLGDTSEPETKRATLLGQGTA
jgi:hypothetical protein